MNNKIRATTTSYCQLARGYSQRMNRLNPDKFPLAILTFMLTRAFLTKAPRLHRYSRVLRLAIHWSFPNLVKVHIAHRLSANGTAIVAVSGRLLLGPEGAELEALVGRLIAQGSRRFVFDFGELTHIDSTGIGRCIASLNQVMAASGDLAIACAKGQVREGFRVTQLDRVFRFFDDVASAEAALH